MVVQFIGSAITISDNHYSYKKATVIDCSNMAGCVFEDCTLKIQLKDENDYVLPSKAIEVNVDGVNSSEITDAQGIADVKLNFNSPGVHEVFIVFNGDGALKDSSKTVNVTVNKQKTLLTAKTKALKLKSKKIIIKVALTDKFKKTISKKVVYLSINKKTYKAKTTSKGIASFKVTLKAKKNYKFTARFKGDKWYDRATKNGKIKVK